MRNGPFNAPSVVYNSRCAQEDDDGMPTYEWEIALSSVVSHGGSSNANSDALGVTEFDPTSSFLATGGIARKIRVYDMRSLLPPNREGVTFLDHNHAGGNRYIFTPAKLSSLKWKPDSCGRVIGSGDYDGVVMEYDLQTGVPIFERDEHGGRRVWSLDYSSSTHLGASGSDDGSMQLWDARCQEGGNVAVIWPSRSPCSICSVEFEPEDGYMVAVGCADKRGYLYDTRMVKEPVMVLEGHRRTVTYVKFLERTKVVTSSVDEQLKLWDVERGTGSVRTFSGHVNSKNFVGLSVWRNGGLLVSGSENNQVYVYDRRWGTPIWVHAGVNPEAIVSSVAWSQVHRDQCVLAAGASDGSLQIFTGFRTSASGN